MAAQQALNVFSAEQLHVDWKGLFCGGLADIHIAGLHYGSKGRRGSSNEPYLNKPAGLSWMPKGPNAEGLRRSVEACERSGRYA